MNAIVYNVDQFSDYRLWEFEKNDDNFTLVWCSTYNRRAYMKLSEMPEKKHPVNYISCVCKWHVNLGEITNFLCI